MVFIWDPCGIFCITLTYGIVFYADYVVIFHLIQPVLGYGISAIINVVCFNLVAFLLCLSHSCAVFSNPGIISLKQYPYTPGVSIEKPLGWTPCHRCTIYRPPRAHHCRICQRCVRRMDHHCPWINNCVGEYNQKYFILFVIYVALLCLYALGLVIVCRAVISGGQPAEKRSVPQLPTTRPPAPLDLAASATVIHTVVLVAICCLFGLFVLAIFLDQYKSIVDDETAIEALQHRKQRVKNDLESGAQFLGRRLSKMALLRDVFGSGPVYMWPLPCHHLFRPVPVSATEQVALQAIHSQTATAAIGRHTIGPDGSTTPESSEADLSTESLKPMLS